jgi:hypothetical protein
MIGIPGLAGGGGLAAILQALQNPEIAARKIAAPGVGPRSLPVLDPDEVLASRVNYQGGGMSDFARPTITGVAPAPPSVIPLGVNSTTPAGDLPTMAGSEIGDTLGGLLSGISELTTPPPLPAPPALRTAPSGAVSGLGGPASTGNVAELLKLLQPGVGGPASLRGAIPSLAQLLGARR